MQQRQPRLGDILDDYCPRERRVTNHAVVAMVGDEVKQTRCTTCDAEHVYKHARVPRQRRKSETPAVLYAQALAGGPKKVAHGAPSDAAAAGDARGGPVEGRDEREEHKQQESPAIEASGGAVADPPSAVHPSADAPSHPAGKPALEPQVGASGEDDSGDAGDGPVHRPLIRATLPRLEGQPPAVRPAPDFTIRQPAGRPNRFKPRHQRGGGQPFQGGRTGGNMGGPPRHGAPHHHTGRPPQGGQGGHGGHHGGGHGHGGGQGGGSIRPFRRQGPGRKRSK
jgi:hypothetical protein